jgi:hypothetical protein
VIAMCIVVARYLTSGARYDGMLTCTGVPQRNYNPSTWHRLNTIPSRPVRCVRRIFCQVAEN